MKIDFNQIDENKNLKFKGGIGNTILKMQADGLTKIMYGKLEPGASIGYHKHETNSEIIFILEGNGKCLYDGDEEQLTVGECHYCPKGHSHSLINSGEDNLVFFAVVPEQ